MGLLLKEGIDINLIKSAFLAFSTIGFLITLINIIPIFNKRVPNYTLQLAGLIGNTSFLGIPIALALLPSTTINFTIGFDLGTTLFAWIFGPFFLQEKSNSNNIPNIKGLLNALINSPASRGIIGVLFAYLFQIDEILGNYLWIPARIVIALAIIIVGTRLGIITNLFGGWIGARYGLRLTLWIGTILQILALFMLIPVKENWSIIFSVSYVMLAQALSGVAKDLNKMSAKSAIKSIVPDSEENNQNSQKQLFKWVSILTGSKNALKGVGFFLGGLLYKLLGFNNAVGIMGLGLCFAFFLTLCLPKDSGKMKRKPIFKDLYSKSKGINILSSARFFLFGARDVWFVVALRYF